MEAPNSSLSLAEKNTLLSPSAATFTQALLDKTSFVDVYLHDALAAKGLKTDPQDEEIATRLD
jgi:hypothetical protein